MKRRGSVTNITAQCTLEAITTIVSFRTGSISFAEGIKKTLKEELNIHCSIVPTRKGDSNYYSCTFFLNGKVSLISTNGFTTRMFLE
ncbi:hypothetical protein [Neobacillus cucumis]|uniref:hypothetical protein n=1 Tax=Neobacillus cucumis TaxID=1740721 RepID=UPI0028531656|nr:hypothetical protein [Neobacillus cucumis]MDR4949248.1 hypothetical protein [Neobacillus cucumis]